MLNSLKRTLFIDPYVYTRCFIENNIYNFSDNSDLNQVYPNIYVGNYSTSTNYYLLKTIGVTHVITILSSFRPPYPYDFKYLHLEAYDDESEDLQFKFAASNTFIMNALKNNGKVYIHCMCGVSRSISLAIAYMIFNSNQKKRITYVPSKDNKEVSEKENIIKKYAKLNNKLHITYDDDINNLIDTVKKKRRVANPNESFKKQLIDFMMIEN